MCREGIDLDWQRPELGELLLYQAAVNTSEADGHGKSVRKFPLPQRGDNRAFHRDQEDEWRVVISGGLAEGDGKRHGGVEDDSHGSGPTLVHPCSDLIEADSTLLVDALGIAHDSLG